MGRGLFNFCLQLFFWLSARKISSCAFAVKRAGWGGGGSVLILGSLRSLKTLASTCRKPIAPSAQVRSWPSINLKKGEGRTSMAVRCFKMCPEIILYIFAMGSSGDKRMNCVLRSLPAALWHAAPLSLMLPMPCCCASLLGKTSWLAAGSLWLSHSTFRTSEMLDNFMCRLCEGRNVRAILFFRKFSSKVGVFSGRGVQFPLFWHFFCWKKKKNYTA